jgi:hypothetical protein
MRSLLRQTGFTSTESEDVDYNGSITFDPYQFEATSDETTKVSGGLQHLRVQLSKFIAEFDNHLNLLDVHSNTRFFSTQIGKKLIRGTTDIVMVPKQYAISAVAESVLLLFELKLDEEFDLNMYANQVKLEFLAANTLSKFPVRSIVTNLIDKAYGFRMMQVDDNFVLYEIKYASLSAMANSIAEYLQNDENGLIKYTKSVRLRESNELQDMVMSRSFKKQKIFEIEQDLEEYERFEELANDPELPKHLKYQAASEFLRAMGYESSLFNFMAHCSNDDTIDDSVMGTNEKSRKLWGDFLPINTS